VATRRTPAAPKSPGKRLPEKLLQTLPPLEERRRTLYRAQFTELQCRAWGDRTWAKDVLRDAERTIGVARALLTKDEVPGYPLVRLRWLCELVVALQQEVADDGLEDLKVARGNTRALAARASALRTQATHRLKAVLQGNRAALAALSQRRIVKPTPWQWVGELTRLADEGRKLRADEDTALLADDCALTPGFLDSLDALANELAELVPTTWRGVGTNDSAVTSHLEGRVLRELAFLCDQVKAARRGGAPVGALPLPPGVRAASRRR
jgi:hypothetical protein